jgi:hypothetical protein
MGIFYCDNLKKYVEVSVMSGAPSGVYDCERGSLAPSDFERLPREQGVQGGTAYRDCSFACSQRL